MMMAAKHFVVGHPRSGTQLVAALLGHRYARHEQLVTLSWGALIEEATAFYEGRRTRPDIARIVQTYAEEPGVVVDANWKLTWILPILVEMLPAARFIHVSRDPRDNVRACVNLGYYNDALIGVDRDQLAHLPAPDGAPIGRHHLDRLLRWYPAMPQIRRDDWGSLSVLGKNCGFWAETHRLVQAAIPADRVMHVKLDELHRRSEELFAFLELPHPGAAAIDDVMREQVNRKPFSHSLIAHVGASTLPEFEAWSSADREELRRLCGETARMLGFDLDQPRA